MTDGLLRRSTAILASFAMFALCASIEFPWVLLIWIAMIPWIAVLNQERGVLAAAANGLAMSVAFVIAVFSWFAFAFTGYTDAPILVSFALLFLAAPFLQPQFLVFAIVRTSLRTHGAGPILTILAAAAAWSGTEWVVPRLFGDTLGHSLFPYTTLRQGADIAGAPGLTFAILVVNQSLCAALVSPDRSLAQRLRAAGPAIAALLLLTIYGQVRLERIATATPDRPTFTAALVQANIGDYEGLRSEFGTFGAVGRILDVHERMTHDAVAGAMSQNSVDLVVWPEGVYPTTYGAPKTESGAHFDERLDSFVESIGVPLLFGTYEREDEREYNVALLIYPSTKSPQRLQSYRKRRLFPLTEQVPEWLDTPAVRDRLPWLGTWHAGNGPGVFPLSEESGRDLEVAPLICLDAVDPGLAAEAAHRGADLILNLSNDAWFGDSRGARLHLVVSAFRSIETRLPQLRATNTGISATIDAAGTVTSETKTSRPAILVSRITPGKRGETLAVLWGNWFGPAAFFFALTAWTIVRFRRSSANE